MLDPSISLYKIDLARIARSAKDWRWSSYRASAGQSEWPKWLQSERLLSCLGDNILQARERYKAFVAQGKHQPSPWGQLKHQIYLGSDGFMKKVQSEIKSDKDLSEIPLKQRRLAAQPLEHFSTTYHERDVAIAQAYTSGGYSMKQIGDHCGLHYSYISRIIKRSNKAT